MRLVWIDGEQQAFAGKAGHLSGAAAERAFELLLDELDKQQPLRATEIARLGDEKLAELAAELGPTTCDATTMKMLLGRLGDGFLAQALSIIRMTPRELFEAAQPIESEELARIATTLLAEHVHAAESWLLRHASFALAVIAPLAQREARDAYGAALVFLAAHGHVAEGHAWLTKTDSVSSPKTREPLPKFADVAKLPHPTLKGGASLSDDELTSLIDLLRAHQRAAIAQWRWKCERTSLDSFAAALLAAWSDAHISERAYSAWPLEACGMIGGDQTARDVAKHVRAWSKGRTHYGDEYAKLGCNVLATLAQYGSEIARVLLEELGRVGGRLREEAQRLSEAVDVTSREEAKVPTLGLDADGSATFDFGAGTYRVEIDETLTPHLTDASGARIDAFPRMRKGMDEKAYAAAKIRFTGMVKDAKTVARRELALLERRMVDEEPMPLAMFRELFVDHPFLRHLGPRLVWRSSKLTFRVAEDSSFADVHDKPITLAEGAEVVVVHPSLLTSDERKAWLDRLSDYEIMQPFAQLARETFTASPEDRGKHDLRIPPGSKTTRGRIFQLIARGWELKYDRVERSLPDDASARINFTGPVGAWSNDYQIDSALTTVALHLLSPVIYSELLRDAQYLAGVRVGQ